MTLELKSELIRSRGSTIAQGTQDNFTDAIFSIDLDGIVDMMDPGRSSFTIMELVAYKLDPFPQQGATSSADEGWLTRILGDLTATRTNLQIIRQKSINLDTSVPDASQPATILNAINQEERWLASATKIDREMLSNNIKISSDNTSGNSVILSSQTGSDFGRDWVSLEDEKGRGKLIAAPRLIVRYFQYIRATAAIMQGDEDWDVTFQIRLRYRLKKVSKNQMWQMLLQQTPGETLIRSGTAAFP